MVNVEIFNIFNFKYDGSEGTEFLPFHLEPYHPLLILLSCSSRGTRDGAGGQYYQLFISSFPSYSHYHFIPRPQK